MECLLFKDLNKLSDEDKKDIRNMIFDSINKKQKGYQITEPFYFFVPTHEVLKKKIKEMFIDRIYDKHLQKPLIKDFNEI